MVRAGAALHPHLPPTHEVLMASWPVVYGQEDVLQREGREGDLDEAPRPGKKIGDKVRMNNKTCMRTSTCLYKEMVSLQLE